LEKDHNCYYDYFAVISILGVETHNFRGDQTTMSNTSTIPKSPRINIYHKLYPTRIDIPGENRTQLIALLNLALALTLDLKTQVKQAHWNVKGMNFIPLHQLFDQMATQLEEYVDMLAERTTALGGVPMGTVRVVAEVSTLPEYPFEIVNGKDHVIALADRLAPYAKILREMIGQSNDLEDANTADLYTEISRQIDKYLWFLEAHLQDN
jgi:starvation-inducible DNA-binding protein